MSWATRCARGSAPPNLASLSGYVHDVGVPKHTISLREMSRQAKRAKVRGEQSLDTNHWRPKTRADCAKVPRPCPYVTCRYNLFLDVCPNGSIRMPFGEDPDAVLNRKESCALDLAAEGERTLNDVGKHHVLRGERIRHIELAAVAKIRRALHSAGVDDTEQEKKAETPEDLVRALLRGED